MRADASTGFCFETNAHSVSTRLHVAHAVAVPLPAAAAARLSSPGWFLGAALQDQAVERVDVSRIDTLERAGFDFAASVGTMNTSAQGARRQCADRRTRRTTGSCREAERRHALGMQDPGRHADAQRRLDTPPTAATARAFRRTLPPAPRVRKYSLCFHIRSRGLRSGRTARASSARRSALARPERPGRAPRTTPVPRRRPPAFAGRHDVLVDTSRARAWPDR